MFLIVLVIDNPHLCSDLLLAWDKAGVPGATILESRGLRRTLKGIRDDLPLMPTMDDLMQKDEHRHRTIFSVVHDQETIKRVRISSEEIIGPFDANETGFFFVVPVSEAYGFKPDRDEG